MLDLVGVAEIAERAKVKRQTVRLWLIRHDDFPPPVAKLVAANVWLWPDVEAWLAKPRPAGAHKSR